MTNEEQAFLAQIALGWFSVDADGRIWRHARFQGGGASSLHRTRKNRAERSRSRAGQYLRVMFMTPDGRKKVSAHRIVWMVANKDRIPPTLEINHKNGDKADNRPSNLERISRRENVIHAIRVLGRKPKARTGESNASAKVGADDVRAIRKLAGQLSQREIATMFGLTQSAVSAIVVRKSWAHIQ